jgi:hypothetical protein
LTIINIGSTSALSNPLLSVEEGSHQEEGFSRINQNKDPTARWDLKGSLPEIKTAKDSWWLFYFYKAFKI